MSNDEIPVIDDGHPLTMDKFVRMLVQLYEWDIDDVLIQDGEPIGVQKNGRIINVGNRNLELDSVQQLLDGMYKQSSSATLQQGIDHNFTFPVPKDRRNTYRFRVNGTSTMGLHSSPVGVDLTMRTIDQIPPTIDDIKLRQSLRDALFPRTGIVLIGGATGSGKTTTLGALTRQLLTQEDGKRILSYESPIEFDFRAIPNRTGRIAQSDAYQDLQGYAHATANALRRHPDVIMLGEARDAETIQGAVHNAETGHVVYSTVHVNSVGEMFQRMASVFPASDRSQAYAGLVGATRVLMYQDLVPTIDGKRVAAQEYLVLDEALRKQLYETREDEMTKAITQMVQDHGNPLIRDITNFYEQGTISESVFNKYKAESEG